jgi:hypothetical protein
MYGTSLSLGRGGTKNFSLRRNLKKKWGRRKLIFKDLPLKKYFFLKNLLNF